VHQRRMREAAALVEIPRIVSVQALVVAIARSPSATKRVRMAATIKSKYSSFSTSRFRAGQIIRSSQLVLDCVGVVAL